jgi:hypothetical protein
MYPTISAFVELSQCLHAVLGKVRQWVIIGLLGNHSQDVSEREVRGMFGKQDREDNTK